MPDTKHISIAERLKMRIMAGCYSVKLPPVRELSKEFNVSSRTMTKTFHALTEAGIILPGARGTFIAPEFNPITARRLVAIIFPGPPITPLAEDKCFNALCSYINGIGAQLLLCGTSTDQHQDWISALNDARVEGFIFLYSSITVEIAQMLNQRRIPYVSCNWHPENSDIIWVDFDWESTLNQLAEQLIRRRIKRIAVIQSSQQDEFKKMLYSAWNRVCRRNSITDYGDGGENFDGFFEHDAPPQAIIALHPQKLADLTERYRQSGQKFLTIAYGKIGEADSLGFVGRDWLLLAENVWNMLTLQWKRQLSSAERTRRLKPLIRIIFDFDMLT